MRYVYANRISRGSPFSQDGLFQSFAVAPVAVVDLDDILLGGSFDVVPFAVAQTKIITASGVQTATSNAAGALQPEATTITKMTIAISPAGLLTSSFQVILRMSSDDGNTYALVTGAINIPSGQPTTVVPLSLAVPANARFVVMFTNTGPAAFVGGISVALTKTA
jgi:hypothetical protein